MKNPIFYLLLLLFSFRSEAQKIYGFADQYFVSFNPYTEQADTLLEFEGPPEIDLGFRSSIDPYNGRYFFGGIIPGLKGQFHIIDLDSLTIFNYPVYPQNIEYDFLHDKLVYEYSGSFYSLDLGTMVVKKLSDIENGNGQVFGDVRTYLPQLNQYVYLDYPHLSPQDLYYTSIDVSTGAIACRKRATASLPGVAGLVTNYYTDDIFGHANEQVYEISVCDPQFRKITDIPGYLEQENTELSVYDHIHQKYIVPFKAQGSINPYRYALIDPYQDVPVEIVINPFGYKMDQQRIYDKPCPTLISLHDTLFVPIGKKYTWFLNGNLLDVTTGLQNYWVPDMPGSYSAEVEFKTYACTSNPVEVTTVGTHEVSSQELMIYPNPVLDEAWINNVEPPFQYTLLDMTGKVIREGVSENNFIPVEGLMSGSYIIQVLLKERWMTGRMVKM